MSDVCYTVPENGEFSRAATAGNEFHGSRRGGSILSPRRKCNWLRLCGYKSSMLNMAHVLC